MSGNPLQRTTGPYTVEQEQSPIVIRAVVNRSNIKRRINKVSGPTPPPPGDVITPSGIGEDEMSKIMHQEIVFVETATPAVRGRIDANKGFAGAGAPVFSVLNDAEIPNFDEHYKVFGLAGKDAAEGSGDTLGVHTGGLYPIRHNGNTDIRRGQLIMAELPTERNSTQPSGYSGLPSHKRRRLAVTTPVEPTDLCWSAPLGSRLVKYARQHVGRGPNEWGPNHERYRKLYTRLYAAIEKVVNVAAGGGFNEGDFQRLLVEDPAIPPGQRRAMSELFAAVCDVQPIAMRRLVGMATDNMPAAQPGRAGSLGAVQLMPHA